MNEQATMRPSGEGGYANRLISKNDPPRGVTALENINGELSVLREQFSTSMHRVGVLVERASGPQAVTSGGQVNGRVADKVVTGQLDQATGTISDLRAISNGLSERISALEALI